MAKREVHYTEYLKETISAMGREGLVLCTVDREGRPNAMAIGWGAIGIIWSRPIFVVLVRPSRFTYSLLEECRDFTVNVLPREMADVVTFCGTVSGRTHDKFAEKGLTAVPARFVQSPLVQQAVIQYECKVVHSNDVLAQALASDVRSACYPSGDYHRIYFGEILTVYADPDARDRVSKPEDT
ncbi:MAG: flavin reductase family protein [Armatimonadota bacterium]